MRYLIGITIGLLMAILTILGSPIQEAPATEQIGGYTAYDVNNAYIYGYQAGVVSFKTALPEADILPLEVCIEKSYQGARNHEYYIDKGEDVEHHTYWRDVHLSSAYWLEKLGGE